MPTEDIRLSDWSLTASAGTTARLVFTSPDALTSLSVYTGGTVTDVDDLTGATAYAGTLSGGNLVATVDLVVPEGASTPLRLVVNGAVQTVGRLHPRSNGTASPDNTITLTPGTYEFDLTILGVVMASEAMQDLVGQMFTGNTETGITATYDDSDGTIDLVAEVTQAELDAEASTRSAADTALAASIAGLSATYQPLDSDLTAIAALSTTAYGRALLALADAAALRSTAGLILGTDIYSKAAVDSGFQPLDADLTAIAALSTTSFGRSLLAAADATALRVLAGTVIGTDVQAYSADLTDLVARWVAASASGPSSLDFLEDTDNGTNKATVTAPASLTGDRTITLPDATGTVALAGATPSFFVPVAQPATAETGWNALTVNSGLFFCMERASDGAQNREIAWSIWLDAGTYRCDLYHRKFADRGIYAIRVDAVDQGTVDGYIVSGAPGAMGSVTGIVIATSGLHTVSLKMATKNASSSAYTGSVSALQFVRTS